MTEEKQVPQPTRFTRMGSSVYIKLPPDRVEFLELGYLKRDETSNNQDAKLVAREDSDGNHKVTVWNPNQEEE